MPSTEHRNNGKKSTPSAQQEIASLKTQLATAKQHRQKLIERLDKMDSQGKEADADYRWSLLTLAQLIHVDGNPEIESQIEALKSLAKKGAEQATLKDSLLQLKNATLKQNIRAPEQKKTRTPSSPLLKWLRKGDKESPAHSPESPNGIKQVKDTYQGILDELRLNLDESALGTLQKIEKRLAQIDNIDDFLLVRKSILTLIKEYISRISQEREEAASFIREIGKRLIEVEGHMVNSLTFAKDAHQVSSNFTESLEGQLTEFKQSIDTSNDLSELKSAVVTRLSSIKTALESKRQDDSIRLKKTDEQMQQLQQNLTVMKGEIQTAWQRAQNLERELLIDPLTGIYNRRAYDRRMEEELQRYQRYQRMFSLLIFDVDKFKLINDQFGHSVGDMCLKEIINRVRPVLRKSDFLARFGGEEFVVLVPETRTKGAMDVAEKLRQTVESTKFIHKATAVSITISIGVTEITDSDLSHEDIFTRADKALYTAKQNGRNCVAAL